MVKRLKALKPAFWDHREELYPGMNFSFKRKWKLIVILTSFLTLLPLIVMTLVDFNITRDIIEKEVKASMVKGVTSIAASVSSSIDSKTLPPTMDLEEFITFLDKDRTNEVFIVDSKGNLITPSLHYGEAGPKPHIQNFDFPKAQGIMEHQTPDGTKVLSGYAKIPNTDLVVIQLRSQKWLTNLWLHPRLKLMGYLAFSIVFIILSIMGMATILVGRIHAADRKRLDALHHEEHANRLASIGRLASGVAHEINNPLDIINQKTGLIIDLLSLEEHPAADPRLVPLAHDVIDAVRRCGTITRQLLDFARHMEPEIEQVNIQEVVEQVLALLGEEANSRGIHINLNAKSPAPMLKCDRGSLQQIFLNLVENALAAMEKGGKLKIDIRYPRHQSLRIVLSDTGKGIPESELNKIFEPFYSSRNEGWGAGLGLAITYGLVKEMGGDISVKSKLDKGTTFTITLPLEVPLEKETKESPHDTH